jgi:hypothetical protein
MTKITKEYKRISPNVSVAKIKDKTTGKLNWRHRFAIKIRVSSKQEFKDYPIKKFEDLVAFRKYIEDELKKPKGYIL